MKYFIYFLFVFVFDFVCLENAKKEVSKKKNDLFNEFKNTSDNMLFSAYYQ